MKKPTGSWVCLEEKVLLESSFMEIVQRDCKSSEEEKFHRFYLFKSRDWCNIIPITEDGKIVMVRQFRAGISDHTLEIPGGVADKTDAEMQDAALRELTEETGYEPVPGARCVKVGWTHPNPAIQDNRCHSFVVGPVRKTSGQNLDPGEMIDVEEIAIEDLPDYVSRGEISHALMLNTFFFLSLTEQGGREALGRALRGFQRIPATG